MTDSNDNGNEQSGNPEDKSNNPKALRTGLTLTDDDTGREFTFLRPEEVLSGSVDRFLKEASINPGKGCRTLLVDCMLSPTFQEYSEKVLKIRRFHFVALSTALARAYGLEGNFTVKK